MDSPTRMPPLATTRLLIREYREADLPALHRILDIEPAEEHGEVSPPLTDRRRRLEWAMGQTNLLATLYQPPYGDRAVTLRESGEVIGACGLVPALIMSGRFPALRVLGSSLHPEFTQTEIGLFWHIARAHRNHGYATEAAAALVAYAFRSLHVQRVVAQTTHDNLASQAVMRHLGMTVALNPLPEPSWLQVVGVLANPEAGSATSPA